MRVEDTVADPRDDDCTGSKAVRFVVSYRQGLANVLVVRPAIWACTLIDDGDCGMVDVAQRGPDNAPAVRSPAGFALIRPPAIAATR